MIESVRIVSGKNAIRVYENIAVILPGMLTYRLKDLCERRPGRLEQHNFNLVICQGQRIAG
jgi:hypothetical protein